MSIGAAVADLTKGAKQAPMKIDDDLMALSKQVGDEITDEEFIKQEVTRIYDKSSLNRDGSFRNLNEKSKLNIPSLKKLRNTGDVRHIADSLRNVSNYQFDKSGGGVGGTPLIEEALSKPAWQHSGRKVKIVNMKPTEYLARSTKGHGSS